MGEGKLKVAVLGASPKPERYSNMAINSLLEHGHEVIPVNPAHPEISNIPTVSGLNDIEEDIDILTMYVNQQRSSDLSEDILSLNPAKIIFNPGAENPVLMVACQHAGILTEEACTLVLLNTEQFSIT